MIRDDLRTNMRKAKNLLIVIAIVIVFAAIYVARDMLLPIVIGVLVSLTLSPVVRGFQRIGVPAGITAFFLIFGFVGLLVIGGYAMSDNVSDILRQLPQFGDELQARLRSLSDSMRAVQEASDQVEAVAAGGESDTTKVSIEQPSLLAFAAGSVANFGGLVLVGLVLAFFMLASGNMFYVKLVEASPTFADKRRAVKTVRDLERRISHYFLTITIINAALGVAVGTALTLLGLPYGHLWGIAAFALNFLPFLGAVFGVLLCAAFSVITFDELGYALLVPGVYLSLTTLEGNFITPAVLGRRLELNTVSVFLTVIVWSWLWSVPGALMAVPFLLLTKVICDNFEELRTFGTFLGPRAEIPPPDEAPQTA